jgi:hypothetical protein
MMMIDAFFDALFLSHLNHLTQPCKKACYFVLVDTENTPQDACLETNDTRGLDILGLAGQTPSMIRMQQTT